MLKGLGKNKIVLCFRNIKIPVKKTKPPKLPLGMGCVCSKGVKDENQSKKEKRSKKSSKRSVASSRKEEVVVEVDNGGNEATTRLIVSTENAERSAGSTPAVWEDEDVKSLAIDKQWKAGHQVQKRATVEPIPQHGQPKMCRALSVRNGVDGAQVVAGWPTWLTSVAGEAIKGWVPRKADSFQRLDKHVENYVIADTDLKHIICTFLNYEMANSQIGQGTYSSVYRARDLETGKIVALKKVRFVNMDPESVRFMAREILILRRLDHPNVMKLEGLVTSRVSGNLYLVFQYMEHDLTGLVVSPMVRFTEPQIKCFMQQLLCGLEHCHKRGVLHRDIKGANLLIDNSGNLKIGDFGLATFFRANQTQPLTSRVVTLWYRPPELLLGATDYGVSVDLWSTGCILAELFAGKPIMPGRTEVEQLHKIFKLCGSPSEEYWKTSKLPKKTIFKPQQPYKRCVAETFKDFPPSALSLLESLLAFEPERRGMASSALQSDFFTTKPLPCEPSSLPKYPPSKEFDAKVQDEESRRQRPTSGKDGEYESSRKGHRETNSIPPPDANAKLQASQQPNSTSKSDAYNPEENGGSDFPIEPSRISLRNGSSMLVGTSMNALDIDEGRHLNFHRGLDSSGCREFNTQRSFKPLESAARLSRFSNSVASGGAQLDFSRDSSVHSRWLGRGSNARYDEMNDTESTNHLLERRDSAYKNNGHAPRKDNVYALKKTRMHYSGPLMPPGGSIDEMLKEHERMIQVAVRKAQSKNKKAYADNGQTNSLLGFVNSGR